MKINKRIIIKSKTNNKDLCKQVFIIASEEGMDDAMIVHKMVLVNKDQELYKRGGYKTLKQFKDKVLYESRFGIKLSTLNEAIKLLNES